MTAPASVCHGLFHQAACAHPRRRAAAVGRTPKRGPTAPAHVLSMRHTAPSRHPLSCTHTEVLKSHCTQTLAINTLVPGTSLPPSGQPSNDTATRDEHHPHALFRPRALFSLSADGATTMEALAEQPAAAGLSGLGWAAPQAGMARMWAGSQREDAIVYTTAAS